MSARTTNITPASDQDDEQQQVEGGIGIGPAALTDLTIVCMGWKNYTPSSPRHNHYVYYRIAMVNELRIRETVLADCTARSVIGYWHHDNVHIAAMMAEASPGMRHLSSFGSFPRLYTA